MREPGDHAGRQELVAAMMQVQRRAAEGRRCCSRSTAFTRQLDGCAVTFAGGKRIGDRWPVRRRRKKLLGGYWMMQSAESKEEAIEWASNAAPASMPTKG